MRAVRAGILWVVSLLFCLFCNAQSPSQRQPFSAADRRNQSSSQTTSSSPGQTETARSREELQLGTALTRQGQFKDAISHFLAARVEMGNVYAIEFNLSLCYIGVGEYRKAISTLDGLRQHGHENADVENLLAQAYIGDGERSEALAALERAAAISPKNEKLFAFVGDACRDTQDFELGLNVVDIGLRTLPESARLHYERAVFLSELDQFDLAKADFEIASRLGHGSEIGYVAAAHKSLIEGNIADAIQAAREGLKQGENPALLVTLGKALLLSGIVPGQPEFTEARNALEKAVAERPRDAGAHIALGQLDLLDGRLDDAIAHLQAARLMRPDRASIYASLAKAYQRKGDAQNAQETLSILESLNQAQADRIRNAPGERKMGYTGTPTAQPK